MKMTTKECQKLFNYLVLRDKPQYNGDTNTLTADEYLYYLDECFAITCVIDEDFKNRNKKIIEMRNIKIPQLKNGE